jgi:hypothetical protein
MPEATVRDDPAAPGAASPEAVAAPAADPKTAKNQRWTKIAAALFSIVAMIRGCDAMVKLFRPEAPELLSCAASSVNDTLRSLVKENSSTEIVALTDIRTTSESDSAAVCSAAVRLKDNSTGLLQYSVTLENGENMVRISSLKAN